ncbi:MAG: hypothetical protein WC736_16450, partial [Gallionella sp.]
SKAINEALQLDTRNTYLHFLNGFIYHLQARQGDSQKNEMAIEGYRQALRIDPSNWIAQEFLGLTYLDLKQFEQAKEEFSEVLLMSPDSDVSTYGLMVASYMASDPETACAMADRYKKISPDTNARFVRSSISVYASCGEFEKADAMRLEMGKLDGEGGDTVIVDRRLAQWKAFYQARPALLAGNNPANGLMKTDLGDAAETDSLQPPAIDAEVANQGTNATSKQASANTATVEVANDGTPRMVLVDVVMVSTQELIATAKGINLLNALTLQLGSSINGTMSPAYSQSYNSSATPGSQNIITRALTIPAMSYSLNIANANSTLNEVLARPTLAAIEGMPSEFFAGTNLNAAVTSTSSLGNTSAIPVDKRFGVKLAVTPTFLANGKIQLKVEAQRTFLNASVDSAAFAYRLEISETSANANVVMNFGDTLVLSGLSEKETSSTRTGVPGLQDIPGIQYFFSSKRDVDFQRSVLILVTPRMPVYTSKMGNGQSGVMSDSMKALREKFGFSARTPSTVESILNHQKTTRLFREFRQGDVSLERWDRMHSTGDRLRQALDFLYY